MKGREHLVVNALALVVYLSWLLNNISLGYLAILNLFIFTAVSLFVSRIAFISPDVDSSRYMRDLVGHRSIFFHSPLIPALAVYGKTTGSLLNSLADSKSAVIFGFAFAWYIHILADGISPAAWDLPTPNTPGWMRTLTGLICVVSTAYFFSQQFLI